MPPTASEVDDDQLLKEAAHVVLGKEVMANNDEKGSGCGSGNANANGNGEESPCDNVNNLLERYAGFASNFRVGFPSCMNTVLKLMDLIIECMQLGAQPS